MRKKLTLSRFLVFSSLCLTMFAFPATAQVPGGPPQPEWEVSISDSSVTEGAKGSSTTAVFNLELQEGARLSSRRTTVAFATADGTATQSGQDYSGKSGDVVFEPGETRKTVEVTVIGDSVPEPHEQFYVRLFNPRGGKIGDPEGSGQIVDDDGYAAPPPSPGSQRDPDLVVSNPSVPEGDEGQTSAVFMVSLDPPVASSKVITVEYATVDGTAAVSDLDYEGTSGELTFTPGITSRSVEVAVSGDLKPEPDESFFLKLGRTENAGLPQHNDMCPLPLPHWDCSNRRWGEATIVTDDGRHSSPDSAAVQAVVDILDRLPTVQDGRGGVFLTGHDADTNAAISNNPAGAQNIVRRSIGYVTHEKAAARILLVYTGTSSSVYGSPQASRMGIVASGFPPCPSGSVSAQPYACHDIAAAGPSTSGVRNLSRVDFAQYDALVVPSSPALTAAEEQILIDRMADLVSYVNAGGGVVGFAYESVGQPFAYLPGIRAQYLGQLEIGYKVTDLGRQIGLTDLDVNGNDSENVFLEVPPDWKAVDIDRRRRIMSIATRKPLQCDCSDEAQITISNGEVVEGNHGISLLPATVRLTPPSSRHVTVEYTVADDTAAAGSDYLYANLQQSPVKPQKVIFRPGETAKTINIPVLGDTYVEPDETFWIELFNPFNALLLGPKAIGTIVNDDFAPGQKTGADLNRPGASVGNRGQTLQPGSLSTGGPQTEVNTALAASSQSEALAPAQIQGQFQAEVHQQQVPQAARSIQAQLSQARSHISPRFQAGAAMQRQRRPETETAPAVDPAPEPYRAAGPVRLPEPGSLPAAVAGLMVSVAALSWPHGRGGQAPQPARRATEAHLMRPGPGRRRRRRD